MKKRILSIILIAMCVGMAGCSAGSKKPDNTEASAEGATKIFTTVKGDIEIPANPQKIVTDYYLGEFLALGVKPIIASDYALANPFLADYIDGIQPLNVTSSETSLEMITAAEPDLIVTLKDEDYETYSKIAPTVLIPYGSYSDEELFMYIAKMLGKTSEASVYAGEFKTKALAAKDEIQSIVGNQTVSIIEVWPKELYVMGSHFARGGSILYDLWELKAPTVTQTTMVEQDKVYDVVSLEKIPEYAGDFIIYGVLSETDPGFLEKSNIWNGLSAVKNKKVMPYEQVAFMHSDPITLNNQLDIYIEFFSQYK